MKKLLIAVFFVLSLIMLYWPKNVDAAQASGCVKCSWDSLKNQYQCDRGSAGDAQECIPNGNSCIVRGHC